jgi:cytochrome P450
LTPLLEGIMTFDHVQSVTVALDELSTLFTDIIERRSADPRDDLISEMLANVAAGHLTMDEMLPLCMFLPLAGMETTVNLIGNGVLALLNHPEQWRLLRENPDLAAGAAEETLRWDPPVQQYRRVAHEPIELEGARLPVDGELAILAGAANRDPEVYPDPARFDITRRIESDTLAFSAGIHYCLGASLAGMEAEEAFRILVDRLPHLSQAGPVQRRESFIIRGLVTFPVTLSRTA